VWGAAIAAQGIRERARAKASLRMEPPSD